MSFLMSGGIWIRLIFRNFEYDAVPADPADQSPVRSEQHLLPRTQLATAVRAGIDSPAAFRICFRVLFAVFGQGFTPVLV